MELKYERNGKTFSAIWEDLPEASQNYLKQYGFAQSLQDSAAGPTKKAKDNGEDFEAAAEGAMLKRLDSIVSGNVTIRGSTGKSRDSLQTVANDIVRKKIALKGANVSKERFVELAAEYLAKNRAVVQAEFDKRNAVEALPDVDINV